MWRRSVVEAIVRFLWRVFWESHSFVLNNEIGGVHRVLCVDWSEHIPPSCILDVHAALIC